MSDFEVSEDSSITIPIRNLIGMIIATGIVVMGYFALTERITMLERDLHLAERYIEQNSEFRIKWPLGELGSLPDDVRQNSELISLTKIVEANSDFRINWAESAEVQETVRLSHRYDIRLDYIEQRLSQFELEVDKAIDQQSSQ